MSPLIRALESAYYIFRNHSNFMNIQFIIDPDCRDTLESVCDIPNPIG